MVAATLGVTFNMSGVSSPDPLQRDGDTLVHSPHTSKCRSTGYGPINYLLDDAPGEKSLHIVKVQTSLHERPEVSQENTSQDFKDEEARQSILNEAREHNPESTCYPADDEDALEVSEFVFARQPRYTPNHFSGRQQQRPINFEALEVPKLPAVLSATDGVDPKTDQTSQARERMGFRSSQNHHHEAIHPRTEKHTPNTPRSKQVRSASESQSLDAIDAELEQPGNQDRMTPQHTTRGTIASLNHHSAHLEMSEHQISRINQGRDVVMESGLHSRPFADADVGLPGSSRMPPPAPDRTILIAQNSVTTQSDNLREGGTAPRHLAMLDRTMDVLATAEKSPFQSNSTTDVTTQHRRRMSLLSTGHPEEAPFRPKTPVGDLEMPQKHPTSTSHRHRRHRSPQNQPNRPLREERKTEFTPKRSVSRQSNTSRPRKPRRRQTSLSHPAQKERKPSGTQIILRRENELDLFDADHKPGPQYKNHVTGSHYGVLESMASHHNKVLCYSKSIEAKLNNTIANQQLEIKRLEESLTESHARHQQEQENCMHLTSELSLLRQKNDELTREITQRDYRMQGLESKVITLQNSRDKYEVETTKLQNEIEATHSKLIKLQEKSRGYKDHLNKAVAEHQRLWQQSKETSQKTIDEMRKELQEVEQKFKLALAEKKTAQDNLNRITSAKKEVLQQEVDGGKKF